MTTQKLVSFTELNGTQKQNLASKMLDVHPVRLNNSIVEYILAKGWEDPEAPFCWDDVTNNEYYGSVEINGCWEEFTEDERDEKIEIYEYLRDKADRIMEQLEEAQQEAETDEEYNLIQAKIDKFSEVQYKYQGIYDDLEDMDFDQQAEIYQWFSCSNWLIHELESLGECTLDDEFWGRQCCGQSIVLDHCIQQAAFNWFCDYGKTGLDHEFVATLGA